MATREIPLITIENLVWYEVFPNAPETATTEMLDYIPPGYYEGVPVHFNHPIVPELAVPMYIDAENKIIHRNMHEITAIRCHATVGAVMEALHTSPEFWYGLGRIDVHLLDKKAGEHDKLSMRDIFRGQIPSVLRRPRWWFGELDSQPCYQLGKATIEISLKLTVFRCSQLDKRHYTRIIETLTETLDRPGLAISKWM